MTHPSRRPTVLMLFGPSSAGKTSLAKALQQRLPEPAVLLEADRVFPELPTAHPQWQHSNAEVALAFHRAIRVWAESGFDVIVDGSLPYEDLQTRTECLQLFSTYDFLLIGVTSTVPVLEERERSRAEQRLPGWAARQARDIHDGMEYAAIVDTTEGSPGECADRLIEELWSSS